MDALDILAITNHTTWGYPALNIPPCSCPRCERWRQISKIKKDKPKT